ncbi:MAG: hypothetical protein QOH61_2442 [Chloroflexota bacterium]|jgi:hypothetical protein|nr:hypothetical protein [Chloroflexota bacterium]
MTVRPRRPHPAHRALALPVAGGLLVVALAVGVILATAAVLDAGSGAIRRSDATPTTATSLAARDAAASSGATAMPAPHTTALTTLPGPGSGPLPSAPPDPVATMEASASPLSTPQPPAAVALDPPPAPGPFRMDLYREGTFVSELEPIWCVPAAMQTSINLMSSAPPDLTRATQRRLYALARQRSGRPLTGAGAEPEGWAAGLNELGYGPYAVSVARSRKTAIERAAVALRMTGRPVGILAWRGAHSWVMSGFAATADPAWTPAFEIEGIYVEDVWFPRVSDIWGPSRPPDSFYPMAKLPIDYLPWRRPTGRYPNKDGRFVLVLPVLPAAELGQPPPIE